jgi:hypothetical protein
VCVTCEGYEVGIVGCERLSMAGHSVSLQYVFVMRSGRCFSCTRDKSKWYVVVGQCMPAAVSRDGGAEVVLRLSVIQVYVL